MKKRLNINVKQIIAFLVVWMIWTLPNLTLVKYYHPALFIAATLGLTGWTWFTWWVTEKLKPSLGRATAAVMLLLLTGLVGMIGMFIFAGGHPVAIGQGVLVGMFVALAGLTVSYFVVFVYHVLKRLWSKIKKQ